MDKPGINHSTFYLEFNVDWFNIDKNIMSESKDYMSESKYYIPAIEEFHVGFEFEYKIPGDEWEPADISTFNLPQVGDWPFEYALDQGCIRVKGLDKEDILSSGWEDVGSGWYNLKEVSGELGHFLYVRLRIWGKNSFIQAYRYDPKTNPNDRDKDYLFVGNIKNKSELKKLMKQIHIA